MSGNRPYDVVLFGATGYTGRLVAEYLAGKTQESFRWAVAARSREKLQQIREQLGLEGSVGTILADSADPGSLAAMARQAQVVLTTVGPYARYGLPLVSACVEASADYVDLTGEPGFVDELMRTYGSAARQKGIRIVNSCGFDSIPPDLGVFMVAKELPANSSSLIEGFMQVRTSVSGGTWQSAVGAMAEMRSRKPLEPPTVEGRVVRMEEGRPHYEKTVDGWVVPFPSIDPEVVLRSARELPFYGREFRYGHYLRAGTIPSMLGMVLGVGALAGLAQFKATRNLLLQVRKSGDGPSEKERATSFFRLVLVLKDVAGERRVVGEVRGTDPGYGATARMVAESALCLALDRASLPAVAGVHTPAVAMGDLLLARLRQAGLTFELVGKPG